MQYGHRIHLLRNLRITSVGVALVAACTANPYVIGTYSRAGDAGNGIDAPEATPDVNASSEAPDASGGISFSLPLGGGTSLTGTSNLNDPLALGGAADAALEGGIDGSTSVEVTLRLRGEMATTTSWLSDEGVSLGVSTAVPTSNVSLLAPFSDSTRAVALAASGPSYVASANDVAVGDIADDDAAFELVFRAEPGQIIASKGAGASTKGGWSLATSAAVAGAAASAPGSAGSLLLELSDGQELVEVSSEPLTTDAWYDCMMWLSHAAGARIDCNGDAGGLTDIHLLGSLASSTTPLSMGGLSSASPDSLQVAYLSLFRASSGTLGNPAAWLYPSRQRFAALTGVLPTAALGTALPNPGVRASAAYVDLADASSVRHLFLVGEDWPRIACRTDSSGRFCGYLSEHVRGRLVPSDPSAWMSSEATANANQAAFADGELHMAAVVPSTHVAAHVLTASAVFGVTQDVLSFFARAESGHRLGVTVSGQNEAVFDLSLPSASPVGASIEAWGDGLFRCAYTFKNAIAGPVTFEIHLLDSSPAGEPFAGVGQSAWVDIAGLQVDVSTFYPRSLLGADAQPGDQLVFVANDGNVPMASPVLASLQVLLPMAPRLDDQAILNLNFEDNYAPQVDLFVTGDTGDEDGGSMGTLEFSGIEPPAATPTTLWAFNDFTSVIDGSRHSIQAEWNAQAASVWVDKTQAATEALLVSGGAPSPIDRIEVGFSVNSSGPLDGLVSSLALGVP